MSSQVLSVNIAVPREFQYRGHAIKTGIYKEPVTGNVAVERLGLAGDFQVDHRFHGGPKKAVYLYPSEHYEFWRNELPDRELPPGSFGENLTTSGLDEHSVRVGDRLTIGTCVVEVTQPRTPCFKLALKFSGANMIKRFAASGRSGFYLSVVQEGELHTGADIEHDARDASRPTIHEVFTTMMKG